MNKFSSEYSAKLIKREEVISKLRPNDRIICHGGVDSFLSLLDENLNELKGIELFTMFMVTKPYTFLDNQHRENLTHYSSFVSPAVREQLAAGNAPEIILTHYSDTDDYVEYRVKPTVLFCQVTPLDEDGYFTMGFNSLGHKKASEIVDRIIVQVNEKLPRIAGECNRIHISQVSYIYEDTRAVYVGKKAENDETDLKAASYIAERIPNGATLQIGVGRVPDAIPALLTNHKDLGVHTEMFSSGLMDLMKCGAINNSKKEILPGKSIFSFSGGIRATQELYDFVDNNKDIEMYPIAWVNDPRTVAQISNFVSINSALSVDLTGQVCSETIGLRTFTGPGGQLDFVRGARWSKGGQSYIVINSVVDKPDGTKISKIDLTLALGSAVTTTRADVDCIVTEYGIAELRFKSLAERAKALINIAHPDFRDELTAKAVKAGYFV